MNIKQAYKILGLTGEEDIKLIKKKYRRLMHECHPDAGKETADEERARKLNVAYDTVINNYKEIEHKNKKQKENTKKTKWSGKENPNAFVERPIYHNVEGFDGENIGTIEVAYGKYVWSLEEEFSLFLKSIFDTSKRILADIEEKNSIEPANHIKQEYLAKLTYLLTGQFIDSRYSLEKLSIVEGEIYKVDAMLELDAKAMVPKPGTALFPAGIKDHKLYIRNRVGEIIGYLSFKDDRLYYVVIPLFEQKRAQVKMVVVPNKLKSRTRKKYADLDLQIKINNDMESRAVESIELKIKELLDEYVSINKVYR